MQNLMKSISPVVPPNQRRERLLRGLQEKLGLAVKLNIDLKNYLPTASSTVHISTGKWTTEEEIDFTIQVLTEAVKKLT
jgi:selenocysteine lyase/cysteine desulfurase